MRNKEEIEEFLSMPQEWRIKQALDWHREVRPKLIEEAIENGMPESLVEYLELGGCSHFSFLDGVDGDPLALESAIQYHFENLPEFDMGPVFRPSFDLKPLKEIKPREITREEFYGTSFDPKTRRLTEKQCYAEPGQSTGEFAYAFAHPAIPMGNVMERLQSIFEEVDRLIFPEGCSFSILDWSDRKLKSMSDYYDAGFEYWGAFLFTIYVPKKSKITVISASSSD